MSWCLCKRHDNIQFGDWLYVDIPKVPKTAKLSNYLLKKWLISLGKNWFVLKESFAEFVSFWSCVSYGVGCFRRKDEIFVSSAAFDWPFGYLNLIFGPHRNKSHFIVAEMLLPSLQFELELTVDLLYLFFFVIVYFIKSRSRFEMIANLIIDELTFDTFSNITDFRHSLYLRHLLQRHDVNVIDFNYLHQFQ